MAELYRQKVTAFLLAAVHDDYPEVAFRKDVYVILADLEGGPDAVLPLAAIRPF